MALNLRQAVARTLFSDAFASQLAPDETGFLDLQLNIAGNEQVRTNPGLRMRSLTTAERNALTAATVVNGTLIYNETDDQFQGRTTGGGWTNLGGGGGGGGSLDAAYNAGSTIMLDAACTSATTGPLTAVLPGVSIDKTGVVAGLGVVGEGFAV